jgi:hypothetical protein
VVAGTTGNILGTFTAAIPARASRQFSIDLVEQRALPTIASIAAGEIYSLYVRATFNGFVQHILWNHTGSNITTASGCGWKASRTARYVANAHTTRVRGYYSWIVVHNRGAAAAAARFDVYDSGSGAKVGEWLTPAIAPNTARTIAMSEVQLAMGLVPGANQTYLNFVMREDFSGFVQHIVDSRESGVLANTTDLCDLTATTLQ